MKLLLPLLALVAACGPSPRSLEPDAGASGDAAVCTGDGTCPAGEACCDGACTSDPTCALTLTSASVSGGFIGGGTYVELRGTGFGPGLRAHVGDGRAPVRVLSDSRALIVTPPAVGGTYDLRVELGGFTASLPSAFEYYSGDFTDAWVTVAMQESRGNYPAMTALQDGRVLIVGGAHGDHTSALASAELYEPTTRVTVPTAGAMAVPRFTVAAITLLDGRVLIVGVCNMSIDSSCAQHASRAVAEVFDPVTATFSTLASRMLDSTRVYVVPVLLPDGRVLVQSRNNRTAELFDPETNTFSLMSTASHFAALGRPTRLRDGRVAFVSEDGIEIYDPDAETLTVASTAGLSGSLAVFTLPDGRVVSPGGFQATGGNFVPTDRVAIFDPAVNSVQFMPQSLTSPRMSFGSALLRDGSIMVAAGIDEGYPQSWYCTNNTFPITNAVDRVDPISNTVSSFTPLPDPNMGLIATTLLDGSILVGGGSACGGAGAYPYLYFLESAPIL